MHLSIMIFHPHAASAQRAVEVLKAKGYDVQGTADEVEAENFVEHNENVVCLMFTTGNFSTSEWFIPPGTTYNDVDLIRIKNELKNSLSDNKSPIYFTEDDPDDNISVGGS